jgi:hypothetical protein
VNFERRKPFAMGRRSLLLAPLTVGCVYETESDDPMARKYPTIQNPPPNGLVQVATVIPRAGGWSGDNQLGYQAKYGPDKRGTQTILKLDEWGPPDVWTISLSLEQKFAASDGVGVVARIGFGAGGSTQVIHMDWANGAQISLPMNAINVQAVFRDVDVTTEGRGLSLGVQLARGRRGGNQPPRYTIAERLVVDVGTSPVFELPAFASAVYVQPITLADAPDVFSASCALRLVRGTIGNANAIMLGDQLKTQKLEVGGQSSGVQFVNGSAGGVVINLVADLYG